MALSASEISRIARLARLELSAEEARLYAEQLSRVVDYIDHIERHEERLGRSDEPTRPAPAGTESTAPRLDAPGPTLDLADFLRNAPAALDRFLLVPQVK
jgi:aspartyl-tRNA(Asn)/glutamyl-tRNA(Gln) amidotransferase subunit C